MNAAACVVSGSRDVGVDVCTDDRTFIEYEGANPLMGVRQRPIPEQADMASSNILSTHMAPQTLVFFSEPTGMSCAKMLQPTATNQLSVMDTTKGPEACGRDHVPLNYGESESEAENETLLLMRTVPSGKEMSSTSMPKNSFGGCGVLSQVRLKPSRTDTAPVRRHSFPGNQAGISSLLALTTGSETSACSLARKRS